MVETRHTTRSGTGGTGPRANVPRRPVGTRVDGGAPRRARSARESVLAVLMTLALASLLNVESLERTAESQPYGWRRSVATTMVSPVSFVAGGLHLTGPRRGIEALAEGEDEAPDVSRLPRPYAVFEVLGADLDLRAAQAARFAPRAEVVWVGGDSMAHDIARAFQRAEGASGPAFEENTRISTGLARPDVHDWPAAADEDMHRLNPDVAVFAVGGNDDQDMEVGGTRLVLGSEEWKAEYRRRVGATMDALATEGRHVVWVGYPVVRDGDLSDHLEQIEILQRAEAELRPSVEFVATWNLFTDESGVYADYLPDDGGRLERMRRGDGVHMTPAGGDRMLGPILAAVLSFRGEG